MAGSDYYRTGKGIFGGPGGTYGRYGVSQMAGNLSSQFEDYKLLEKLDDNIKRIHESKSTQSSILKFSLYKVFYFNNLNWFYKLGSF